MHEVDDLAVDGRGELRDVVQHGLLVAPIEAIGPVPGQLAKVSGGHARAPNPPQPTVVAIARRQSPLKVVESLGTLR